jgi:lysophospholipase L1-like esterase
MSIFDIDNIIHGETVVFIQSGSSPPEAELLFDVNEILQVCDTSGELFYEREKDYEIQGRRAYLIPKSRIPFIQKHQMFPCIGAENSIKSHIDGKRGLLFSEGSLFPDLQPRFTYRCKGAIEEPEIIYAGKLPRLQEFLKKERNFSFVTFGDSISAGANATKFMNVKPFLSIYSEQLVCELENRFKVKINFHNESVIGKSSSWGLESIDNVSRHKPDITILAWGMNDASERVKSKCFGENIGKMIQKLREVNKNAEFLLVSTMCGNPDWSDSNQTLYHEYRNALLELCGDGVALADITSVWEFMCERKKFIDITGNGVNHPNDFGHMIYKQAILDVLI